MWLRTVYGDKAADMWKGIAPKILTVSKSWDEAYGLFTKGEAPLVLSYTTSQSYQGLSDKTERYKALVFPECKDWLSDRAVMLNKAPHPSAARLCQAWFLTTEAQNAIVTLGNSYGLTPSVQLPSNEADWPKLGPIAEALKAVSPEQYMEAKATLAKVEGASFK